MDLADFGIESQQDILSTEIEVYPLLFYCIKHDEIDVDEANLQVPCDTIQFERKRLIITEHNPANASANAH